MDMHAFAAENRARCEAPNGFNHALSSWSLSDWITAALGELGEAANVVKKLNRVRDGITGNKESEEELRQAEAVMVRELEVIVQSHSTDYDWREGSPLPNVDADAMEHVQPIVDAIAATRRAMGHG